MTDGSSTSEPDDGSVGRRGALGPRWRRGLLALAVVAIVAVVVVVVDARRSGRLEPSPTCEDVEPGGTRFRSPLPPGTEPAEPAPPGEDSPGVDPAFRPADAEPVYCEDFADPFVLSTGAAVGTRIFAYATNTSDSVLPVLSTGSLLRSEEIDDALAELPSWSEPGAVWAPSVLERDDGGLVLYYTTTHRESGLQCISRAVADDPLGPFVDRSTGPIVCPADLGGAIDPSPFVTDDGTAYLLWKNDGNCCDILTRIWIQRLSDDREEVTGEPSELIAADQRWEGGVVEGPSMVEHDGRFHLFYSANAWDTAAYAIGHARCEAPAGPCTKSGTTPWLASSEGVQGPGGQELFDSGGDELQMVFHAWPGEVGYDAGGFRSLFTTGIDFVDGDPVVVE